MKIKLILALITALFSAIVTVQRVSAAEFVAVRPDADFALPVIVFPDGETETANFAWEKLSQSSQAQSRYEQQNPAVDAVRYLREAVQRMTGKELPVALRADKSNGFVLTTLERAPADIKNDPKLLQALRNTGEDAYNANEAFYIRTEPKRVLLVANTTEGLEHAVVELLESAGYEVLGMGPNWTHVPDFHDKPLVFDIERAGRPGFYIRELAPSSGQAFGIGTLFGKPLPDAADEPVEVSYNRWSIGTHIVGNSMPRFPGNMLQTYHRAVVDTMRATNSTAGFLNAAQLGPDGARPPASEANKGHIWINTGETPPPPHATMFVSDGKSWVRQTLHPRGVKLDLSVPLVREIILDDLKQKSEVFFAQEPKSSRNKFFIFGTEAEDGVQPVELTRNPNWYPEYLKKEGVTFGQPYVLNGFKGLKQPRELWDPLSYSDTVFGFNNWLLREYDKWIDSLPPAERVTKDGASKKQLVRASLYSYSAHDVPPNFNLDPRIRVMLAGYPKHRGYGKWKNFKTQADMAQAFRVLLPREPAGDYWITSLARYRDFETRGIGGSRLAATVQQRIRAEYDAGFRAMYMEIDFNFGKMGLEYYLYSKMLWNPQLTATELDAIRDRWLQRAFGDGWREMKQYYDFMAPENFTVNAPNNWAKAMRFIVAADAKISDDSPAQKRIDDLKQFWYFYYLRDSGQDKPTSRAFREFAWKGQMSYMTAMHMVMHRLFNLNDARQAAGAEFTSGAAHYTHEETQAWWAKVLDHWQVTPVADFADAVLAGGKPGREIDVNDLVAVAEFQSAQPDSPFFYHSGSQENATVLTLAAKAGDEVGFKLFWPYNPDAINYREKSVSYDISRWDAATESWRELVDETTTSQPSHAANDKNGKVQQLVEVRYKAPEAGTYRLEIGYGGLLAHLASLNYDLASGEYSAAEGIARGFTFCDTQAGITQSPTYIYIPKGIKSFDLEVWGPTTAARNKKLILHSGLPSGDFKPTRTLEVGESGTHTVKLNPGEDGSIAVLQSNGFYFPYLYSVPLLWAKSPQALLVPRDIAKADGLTVLP